MKKVLLTLLFFYFLAYVVNAQSITIDKAQFFQDTSIINATITTNLSQLYKKKDGTQYPANFSATFSNGFSVNEPILLETRGNFRKEYCYLPPLRIIFKSQKNSVLKPLGTLKMVNQCMVNSIDEQYIAKEFLAYKIYNLLTDMSFRVRLLNVTLVDSFNKKKTVNEHAFLVEDIKDVAKRNNCTDCKNVTKFTEATNRKQMTMVAVFQYMIGNTDWSVPNNHNIRLILSKIDSSGKPYVIPYDFDYSGFVNTDYALPDKQLNIDNVRTRLYRGFPRTMPELNDVLDVFKKQKSSIYALINDFELVTPKNKKDLYNYLDQFFEIINNPLQVSNIFIRDARTE